MNKEVYIIGGGSSLKDFDFNKLKGKDVIAVNRAFFYLPFTPKYFITIDYSFLFRYLTAEEYLKLKNSPTAKIIVIPLDVDYIIESRGQIIDKRTNLVYNLELFDVIIKSYKKDGIGFSWSNFANGHNSGLCALQFAVISKYKEIYLLGMDLTFTKETHFHKDYEQRDKSYQNKLDRFYHSWVSALKELKDFNIYSCSKISRLNNIIKYKEV